MKIGYDNAILRQSIKQFVYFSEIYPKKHRDIFINLIEPSKIRETQEFRIDIQDKMWRRESVREAEGVFDEFFCQKYQELFIDQIFGPFINRVTRKQFIDSIKDRNVGNHLMKNIIGNKEDGHHKGTASWIFTPRKLR